MRVSAETAWFQYSSAVEPRHRPVWEPARGFAVRLRARLALALRAPAEPRLEDLSPSQLADIGLRPDRMGRAR